MQWIHTVLEILQWMQMGFGTRPLHHWGCEVSPQPNLGSHPRKLSSPCMDIAHQFNKDKLMLKQMSLTPIPNPAPFILSFNLLKRERHFKVIET
ncbi:hypothetical protein JZ751_016083 [Albula glossodonta]|uniref:Uncharacterized protein n=1 Tax=Albula glossodonta TaxID=121402 RepID=A0A8T2NSW1_9TELE|nr:hypothetical protein JZ751_016083 [Albula glossodonta]